MFFGNQISKDPITVDLSTVLNKLQTLQEKIEALEGNTGSGSVDLSNIEARLNSIQTKTDETNEFCYDLFYAPKVVKKITHCRELLRYEDCTHDIFIDITDMSKTVVLVPRSAEIQSQSGAITVIPCPDMTISMENSWPFVIYNYKSFPNETDIYVRFTIIEFY